MRVGFFTVFRRDPIHYLLAEVLCRSVRAVMPGVPIVQFTDELSPLVYGADCALRRPAGRMLERRLEHYASCEGEWLLIDTDVLVRADVRHVFAMPFEVALTDRAWPHMKQAKMQKFNADMPYNTGVVFARNPRFWTAVLEHWRALPAEQQDWLSEQRAVAAVVKTFVGVVGVLPGAIYNYPPNRPDDVGKAQILHFKGERKAWMRALWPKRAPAGTDDCGCPILPCQHSIGQAKGQMGEAGICA